MANTDEVCKQSVNVFTLNALYLKNLAELAQSQVTLPDVSN